MKNSFVLFLILFQYLSSFSQAIYGVTEYPNPPGYPILQLSETAGLGIDASNNKWIAYKHLGLGKFSSPYGSSDWTMYDTSNSQIPSNDLTSLFVFRNDIFIGTIKGLSKFDGLIWDIYDTTNGLPDNYINAVCFKNENLWAGTNKGAAYFDGNNWTIYNTLNSNIISDTVTAIEIDSNGSVWLGTKNGLSCLLNNSFTNYNTANSGLSSNYITCLKSDHNNNLWIGTKANGAYKMSNNAIIPISTIFSLPATNNFKSVFSIAITNNYIIIPGDLEDLQQNNTILFGCIFKISQADDSYFAYSFPGNNYDSLLICQDTNNILWSTQITHSLHLKSFDYKDTGAYMFDQSECLSVNNIKARFNAGGMLFRNFQESTYEVPRGGGVNSLFSGTLWIGGKDAAGQLHVAAEKQEQDGRDFFPGPVMDSIYYFDEQEKWNKVWKVTRAEINTHLANYGLPGYTAPPSITKWPAHGDLSKGQSFYLAPFFDNNADGVYNPQLGDYPLIKGDEALFFIFNDDKKPHTESHGNKMRLEIQAMAYAYECPDDSAFWNTIFVNYKIINRSHNTYQQTYLGTFIDPDLGGALDDYIGCDVQRGSFFVYNADSVDEDWGGNRGYGAYPPAQGITILGGPYLDPDGLDNRKFRWVSYTDTTTTPHHIDSTYQQMMDESINGMNFGDSIIDNERFGMSSFISFSNNISVITHPQTAYEYYGFLHAILKDNSSLFYGGNGILGSTACGPEAMFMFPGNSDSIHWGTFGVIPNCHPDDWTEETANNTPSDRRVVASMGPFTFRPDSVQELDLAFVFGRDFINPDQHSSIAIMKQRIDSIHAHFQRGAFPCRSIMAVHPVKRPDNQILIYPNPANNHVTVDYSEYIPANKTTLELWSISGCLLQSLLIHDSKTQLNISALPVGLYIIKVTDANNVVVRKIVKD